MFNKFRKVFILAVGIATFGLFQSVNADWEIDTDQDIVISLQSNPMTDPERACLAVTFARMLSGGAPSANVTLFVTLDGVSLADGNDQVFEAQFKCTVPESMATGGEITLKDHLELFLGSPKKSDDMVVCPLCWNSRYGSAVPFYGVKTANIKTMIFNAEKILDF